MTGTARGVPSRDRQAHAYARRTIGRTAVVIVTGDRKEAWRDINFLHAMLKPRRPLRFPLHTVSPAGFFGTRVRGELSYAHGGILVMFKPHRFATSILRELAEVLRAGMSTGRHARPVALVLHVPR